MSELCYRIFTPQCVVKRHEASSCRKALSSGTLHDGIRERAHLLPLLSWSESAMDPHEPCSVQKQIVYSAHISNTLSKTMSIDSMQDCIKPRLSYRPYGSLECIFLLHRVETRHFFSSAVIHLFKYFTTIIISDLCLVCRKNKLFSQCSSF